MRDREGEDWWHNPAGWALVGLVPLYVLSRAPGSEGGSSPLLVALWLGLIFAGVGYLSRDQPTARRRLVCVVVGLLLGLGSLLLQPPPPPQWDGPPREYRGALEVERWFGSSNQEPDGWLSGIGRLQPDNSPIWERLRGQRIQFRLHLEGEPKELPLLTGTYAARGVLRPRVNDPLPSGFERYLDREGVSIRLGQGVLYAEPVETRTIRTIGYRFLHRTLSRGTDHRPREQGVYLAMLLGDRSYLDPADRPAFLRSGTMHLFAISGLHIGILAGGLFLILRVLRFPRGPTALIGLSILGLFVYVTGMAPSAVRAWAMVAVFWGGYGLQRKPHPFRSLCLAALLLLVIQPGQLREPGFQLSYSVVAVLLLWGLPVIRLFPIERSIGHGLDSRFLSRPQQIVRGVVKTVWQTFVISLAAFLGSASWIACYFELITPAGLLFNLPAALFASGVLFSGLVACTLEAAGVYPLVTFYNQGALLILNGLLGWIGLPGAEGPFAWEVRHPPVPGAAGFACLLGILVLVAGRRALSRAQAVSCAVFPVVVVAGLLVWR